MHWLIDELAGENCYQQTVKSDQQIARATRSTHTVPTPTQNLNRNAVYNSPCAWTEWNFFWLEMIAFDNDVVEYNEIVACSEIFACSEVWIDSQYIYLQVHEHFFCVENDCIRRWYYKTQQDRCMHRMKLFFVENDCIRRRYCRIQRERSMRWDFCARLGFGVRRGVCMRRGLWMRRNFCVRRYRDTVK